MRISIYDFKIVNSKSEKIDIVIDGENPLQIIELAEECLMKIRHELQDKAKEDKLPKNAQIVKPMNL